VLADRRAGHFEGRGNLPGRELVVRDEAQDGSAAGLGEGAQCLVQGRVVAAAIPPSAPPGTPGQAHSPTGFPSGSAKMANRP
jgi:hypothetical protein